MKNVEKKADDNLMPQLRTAYYICKQGLEIDRFSSLMDLQKLKEDMVEFWRGIMQAPAIKDDRGAVPVGPELSMLLDPVSLEEAKLLVELKEHE